jgi:hypothetical protein
MSGNISLEQPFLEQESVREILNLPTEDVSPKVGLEDILKIAQSAIQSELVNCGRAPTELIGLRVYCTSHESSDYREAPSSEWGQLIKEPENISASDAKDTPSIQLPIASKFLGDLGGRLAEMSTKTSSDLANVSMLLSFSPSTTLGVGNCDKDGYIKGSRPKVPCVPPSTAPSKSEQ